MASEPTPQEVAGKRLIFWVSLVGLLIVDQAVKAWVRGSLRLEETLPLPLPGIFEIRRANNTGIAFGQLEGKGVLLTPIAVIIAAGAVWYVYNHKKESRWNHAAFGLLASGALGNLYDRVVLHQVTDMFWFRAINFPIFNIADACITVATIMLMIGWWREAGTKPAVVEPQPTTARLTGMPNPEETSKSNAATKDVPLESAAPFGHDEIASHIAQEALGDGAATEPLRQGSRGVKDGSDTAEENPKRNENSRPD